MDGYIKIERKLHQFVQKYYTNELIKGSILFFSLGCLYLLFTLFLEYFLWLKPTARTVLFWLFILVEFFLLIRFIAIPIFKLFGLSKGITLEQSSTIIGNHFPEVEDKLLNILQLKTKGTTSDLLLASINQKSKELQFVPFLKAIDFKKNRTYLKYAIIPVLIFVITLFTGNKSKLSESLQRVVNHNIAYHPPAPFSFFLENSNLNVIQGTSISILVSTKGNVLPIEAHIHFNNQRYFLNHKGDGLFSYTFDDVQKPIEFYIESNGITSKNYKINVIGTPIINTISLLLKYPNYLGKKSELIENSGNLTVAEGTNITWQVKTLQTDAVAFIEQDNRVYFNFKKENFFEFSKIVNNSFSYRIASSNNNLKDYESLQFSVDVLKDEYPLISVTSNIDSITRGSAEFAGRISDDYGLKRLELVYFNEDTPSQLQKISLPIGKENIQTFFYQFPDGLNLTNGINYKMYFLVFDNDGINGNKSAKSKVFNYRQKTKEEVEEDLLIEQKNTINNLENSIKNQKNHQQQLKTFQEDFLNKKNINWNDKKKVENFIKRQEQYKNMMQRQTEKLQENLDEKIEENKSLQEKKENLKERIKELKKLEKQQKLLDEIQKMANKLDKNNLVKKAKELAQQNKQQQRSLEKTLELVKRFYVEQKTMQIANKIDNLSKKQETISNQKYSSLEKQNEIKKEFNTIKKSLEELNKDNNQLKDPIDLPDVDDEKNKIDKELNNIENKLKSNNTKEAKSSQKQSSKKMKEMSVKMQQAMMEMEAESMDENIDDLRKILENLVIFSFQQEDLMNKFQLSATTHPDFGNDLKKQNDIKTYFEHIDDSLYVLSMRIPKISTNIQNNLADVHYNLEQSLYNFSENNFDNGISNQRYILTATNTLADYLSNILNSMQNNMSMKKGKGKPGKKNGFSLPDLIQKQDALSKKMKDGMQKGEGKKGNKPDKNGEAGDKGEGGKAKGTGSKNGDEQGDFKEDLNGELYEIFKQQSLLRQELENAIKKSGKGTSDANAKKALKTMEELETEILEKGFNSSTLQKMQNLSYELLKLDKAALEQGEDNKRKSNTNNKAFNKKFIRALQFKKQFYNQTEILNRQSLPLQQNYKNKVRVYFSDSIK